MGKIGKQIHDKYEQQCQKESEKLLQGGFVNSSFSLNQLWRSSLTFSCFVKHTELLILDQLIDFDLIFIIKSCWAVDIVLVAILFKSTVIYLARTNIKNIVLFGLVTVAC